MAKKTATAVQTTKAASSKGNSGMKTRSKGGAKNESKQTETNESMADAKTGGKTSSADNAAVNAVDEERELNDKAKNDMKKSKKDKKTQQPASNKRKPSVAAKAGPLDKKGIKNKKPTGVTVTNQKEKEGDEDLGVEKLGNDRGDERNDAATAQPYVAPRDRREMPNTKVPPSDIAAQPSASLATLFAALGDAVERRVQWAFSSQQPAVPLREDQSELVIELRNLQAAIGDVSNIPRGNLIDLLDDEFSRLHGAIGTARGVVERQRIVNAQEFGSIRTGIEALRNELDVLAGTSFVGQVISPTNDAKKLESTIDAGIDAGIDVEQGRHEDTAPDPVQLDDDDADRNSSAASSPLTEPLDDDDEPNPNAQLVVVPSSPTMTKKRPGEATQNDHQGTRAAKRNKKTGSATLETIDEVTGESDAPLKMRTGSMPHPQDRRNSTP